MLARIAKSVQIGSVALRQYQRATVYAQIRHFSDKADKTTTTNPNEQNANDKLGTFAKAFNELEKINEKKDEIPVESASFMKLLRQSKLIDVSRT